MISARSVNDPLEAREKTAIAHICNMLLTPSIRARSAFGRAAVRSRSTQSAKTSTDSSSNDTSKAALASLLAVAGALVLDSHSYRKTAQAEAVAATVNGTTYEIQKPEVAAKEFG